MRGKKRERIIRILLQGELLTKYKIAKLAQCSYPWVDEFLKFLEQQRLVKDTKVIDKKKLVAYWQRVCKRPKYVEYMIQQPLKLLQKTKLKYALTTYQADNLVEHFLFPSRTDIYIRKEDQEKWHKLLINNGLYGKGNFRILIEDEHVFYAAGQLNGYTVVSIPQLILDLQREGSVCGEAAERLLKQTENAKRSSVQKPRGF